MLYSEIIALCSHIHTKHIYALCGQKVELLNVKLVVQILTTGLWRAEEFGWYMFCHGEEQRKCTDVRICNKCLCLCVYGQWSLMGELWERAETLTKSGLISDHKGPDLTVCRWMDSAAVVLTEAQCGCGPSAGSVSDSPLTVWALSGVCVGQPAHCVGPQRGLFRTARSLCAPSAGSVSDSPLTVWALSGVCVGQPAHCVGPQRRPCRAARSVCRIGL